ncbi:hypothetical protein AQJ43_36700 [Streptomyces avermitilis]|uniref:Uncharacterized protein n=2 Tax=Streptomyces avermitilis TaxID=33903 RepID=A0A143SZF4_STRAW|nr:hypothetical protein [Streptomyces avermitilis]KUN48311.1 hypothetical protein AQJ43_36700 [Streptomyces avermitilis]BAU77571.1 hypothetical protein SAVERM_2p127 [Streptomyces avermitilis MA-4680 = NBRC 14893]GDY70238.1 hypothetical protein SAV14893_096310 [Streptomyces avermitilis]GDY80545.1 hypothetical protein SAV31267_100300 [Streptomyces avermitilis]
MQVRLGLLDQEQRQVGPARGLELGQDGGDVQEVGVAKTGAGDVLDVQALVAHASPQRPGDGHEGRIGEGQPHVLGVSAGSEQVQRIVDPAPDCLDLVVPLQVTEVFGLFLLECFDRFLAAELGGENQPQPVSRAGGQLLLGVTHRRQVHVPDRTACLGLRIVQQPSGRPDGPLGAFAVGRAGEID